MVKLGLRAVAILAKRVSIRDGSCHGENPGPPGPPKRRRPPRSLLGVRMHIAAFQHPCCILCFFRKPKRLKWLRTRKCTGCNHAAGHGKARSFVKWRQPCTRLSMPTPYLRHFPHWRSILRSRTRVSNGSQFTLTLLCDIALAGANTGCRQLGLFSSCLAWRAVFY